MSSLQLDVEENPWRRGEGLGRRVANHAKGKQRNTVFGAGARNEFRLHINGGCACGLRDFSSLLNGIDDRRHRQKIRVVDGKADEARIRPALLDGREIFRNEEITGVQSIVKRACKTGANQTIELSILKKARHPLATYFFSNAGMENLNRAIVDLAANCSYALAMTRGLIAEAAQECRAFHRQCKRDRDHLPRETNPQCGRLSIEYYFTGLPREMFTEGNEGDKGCNRLRSFVISVSFCYEPRYETLNLVLPLLRRFAQ